MIDPCSDPGFELHNHIDYAGVGLILLEKFAFLMHIYHSLGVLSIGVYVVCGDSNDHYIDSSIFSAG